MGRKFENENPWGILLIDTCNTFNEGNSKLMVYVARHEWSTGERFLFNMYRYHAILILRVKKDVKMILSKEGITQGCPLTTTGYGLLVLPVIRQLKVEFSDIYSP